MLGIAIENNQKKLRKIQLIKFMPIVIKHLQDQEQKKNQKLLRKIQNLKILRTIHNSIILMSIAMEKAKYIKRKFSPKNHSYNLMMKNKSIHLDNFYTYY